MSQIALSDIRKIYRIAERPKGRFSALRGAFAREYREVRAVDGISFSLEEGELVGYVGPNGAGKSTTIKIMSGILVPDGGACEIMGRVPWKQRKAHVAQIGVVFGQRSQLWWDTPVSDSFELLRDIYRVSPRDYERRLSELCDMLDCGNLLRTPVRQLSLGQRMRCELVAALLHAPRILFLDEPTIGLDAVSKLALRAFLKRLNEREGVTMILTTHDMDDIEALSRRVMVIGRGHILFDGTLPTLRAQYAPHRLLKATLTGDMPEIRLPLADEVTLLGREVSVRFNPQRLPVQKLVADLAALCPVTDLTVADVDVEELIARMYREMQI